MIALPAVACAAALCAPTCGPRRRRGGPHQTIRVIVRAVRCCGPSLSRGPRLAIVGHIVSRETADSSGKVCPHLDERKATSTVAMSQVGRTG